MQLIAISQWWWWNYYSDACDFVISTNSIIPLSLLIQIAQYLFAKIGMRKTEKNVNELSGSSGKHSFEHYCILLLIFHSFDQISARIRRTMKIMMRLMKNIMIVIGTLGTKRIVNSVDFMMTTILMQRLCVAHVEVFFSFAFLI